ncbi:MAG TPA: IS3 family transposase [Clostridia bacterium]
MREVKKQYPDYKIAKISRLFGKSRQAFYQMETRQTQEYVNDEIILVYVKEIRKEQPRIGTRKLCAMLSDILKANNIKIGRDKFFALMRKHSLLVQRRRRYIATTDSSHTCKVYPNLIKEYIPGGPEQIWASDITYIPTTKGFVYLSLVTDQYSKKIMGYHVHPTLETNGPLKALQMALLNRNFPHSALIHHSDRGAQYCCQEYILLLQNNQIQISMSSKGNPYENAIAERVNGILKTEFNLDRQFKDIEEVESVVKRVVSIYNAKRPHASCDYLTPETAHQQQGLIKKRWENYKTQKRPEQLQPISEEVKEVVKQLIKRNSLPKRGVVMKSCTGFINN